MPNSQDTMFDNQEIKRQSQSLILVVDDDPQARFATARLLRMAGYEIMEAATGIEGLKLAKQHQPDLILLDVVLPDLNGVELCRLIKSDPGLKTYIILLSGLKKSSVHQAEGLESGADGYIIRPISNRELVARVKSILRLKQAEEQLMVQTAELARSNAELEKFAYVASHDLQEPLRMITGYLKLLESRYKNKLDADAQDFINYAVDGAERMKRLIDGLLQYSRVNSRGQPFEAVDCNTVLEQTLAILQLTIEDSDATITHEPLPTLPGDAGQLVQLFQNLISNAIKYRGPESPRIHISAEDQGSHWQFAVRDNGIGLDPKDTDRIFELFQRLHLTETYPGTGLGLAICKKIVERHGGRIWVESTPGRSSTFYFTLCRASA